MRNTPQLSTLLCTLSILAAVAIRSGSPVQAQSDPSGFPQRTAMVQLFEWKHEDVARECENHLGRLGFAAVQVSPPSEHVVLPAEGFPWWQRYQTVSYSLDNSRSGTRAQFADMASRCAAAGVAIYVDAVINHTTGPIPAGVIRFGSDGTAYGDFFVDGLYGPGDFHQLFAPSCNSDNSIPDFNDPFKVRHCELLNLYDLATESSSVRARIVSYLNDLISLGAGGFRVDAAKHIPPADLGAIKTALSGGNPFIYQEVFGDGAISESEYFDVGDVTEFEYGEEIARVFRDGKLAWLENFGEAWGLISGPFAIVFVDNHDTQRDGKLSHKEGQIYNLANTFMLAWPYGFARVMSSYHFGSFNQGPPSDPMGNTHSVYNSNSSDNCNAVDWVCEHRRPWIGNMVPFRNWTVGEPVAKWWSNGNNAISFARGDKGYAVINKESSDLNQWFDTGIAAGEYCDAIGGGIDPTGGCAGRSIVVNESGWARIKAHFRNAAAIHAGAKRRLDPGKAQVAFSCDNGITSFGDNVYAVGSLPQLGNWDPSAARKLEPDHYPFWHKVLDDLPPNTFVEWKCIKKDSSGNLLMWQPGANNSLTTPPAGGFATAEGVF